MVSKYLKLLAAKPLISGLVALVIIGGGYLLFVHNSKAVGATLTVHKGNFNEQVRISGTVVPAEHADLGFAESGRISGVYANVGDKVYAGAVLATIENGDLQAAVHQKEAALASAQAKLAALQAGTRPEQIAIDEGAVTEEEATLADAIRTGYVAADDAVHKKADQFFFNGSNSSATLTINVSDSKLANRLTLERIALEPVLVSLKSETSPEAAKQSLMQVNAFLDDASAVLTNASSGSISISTLAQYAVDINTARTTVGNALVTLTSAQSALASAKATLALAEAGSTLEDIAAQAANVQAAEADVQSAKANLAKTFVLAPFTGVVSKMDVKKGEIVTTTTSTISMLSGGVFEVETYIPEVNISGVAVGNSATTTLDAYAGVEFGSKVITVNPAETIKNGVPTYKTTLIFNAADSRIRSGMTADVVITTGIEPDAIVIPQGAVTQVGSDTFVNVVKAGKPEKTSVTLGATFALGLVEVRSGLHEGDVILLKPSP